MLEFRGEPVRPGTLIAAVVLAVSVPVGAEASSMALTLDTAADPANLISLGTASDGTGLYALRRGATLQRFPLRLNADDGTPVTGCLTGGENLVLQDSDGAPRAIASCADPVTGLFEFAPVGLASIQSPTALIVNLNHDTVSTTGQVLSPAASNRLEIFVQPRIINETPRFRRGVRFPIRVRLDVPPPRAAAGRFVFQRQVRGRWVTVLSRTPTVAGRFSRTVTLRAKRTLFRIRFVPAPGTGWIATDAQVTVTRRSPG